MLDISPQNLIGDSIPTFSLILCIISSIGEIFVQNKFILAKLSKNLNFPFIKVIVCDFLLKLQLNNNRRKKKIEN